MGTQLYLGAGNVRDRCSVNARPTAVVTSPALTRTEVPDLVGAYYLPCTLYETSTADVQVYIQVRLYATETLFTTDVEVYVGSGGCQAANLLLVQFTDGEYRLFGPVTPGTTASTAYNAEFTLLQSNMYIASQAVADQYIQLCPQYSWPINSFIDVSTRNCTVLGLTPPGVCPVKYDVIDLNSGQLSYGTFQSTNPLGACNYATRPTQLASQAIPQQVGVFTFERLLGAAIAIAAVIAFVGTRPLTNLPGGGGVGCEGN